MEKNARKCERRHVQYHTYTNKGRCTYVCGVRQLSNPNHPKLSIAEKKQIRPNTGQDET